MAKSTSKSWLPKRRASSGRFVVVKDTSHAPRIVVAEGKPVSSIVHVRSNVSGRIDLPNGQVITTVRKDVMDRALGRGEFKKK